MRHADAACGMRQQMATVGTRGIDSDAVAFCGANTDAQTESVHVVLIKKRIRTRIGQEIPRSDVSTYVLSQLSQMADGISRKVVAFYICHR